MGTDIHMWAEVRRDGTWSKVGAIFPNQYWREGDEEEHTDYGDGYTDHYAPLTDQPWQHRNYDLFAMLADVRNGHGFAGIYTGEGFTPIAAPRGMPDDVSIEARHELEHGPDHTLSWLTLRELQSYDWHGQRTVKSGWFSEGDYIKALRHGPQCWAGDISGPGIVKVTADEYEQMMCAGPREDPLRQPGARYYIRHQWQVSYYQAAQEFVDETLPRLAELGAPDDVRIVFGFDS